jgi:transcriptional regulator with XRE-family HTH domain
MNIGENIYKLRTEKNMSQTDLANALDVSRQSVSKWENNSAVPDLERIVNMSRIFEVSLDELVFGESSEIKNEPAPAPQLIPQITLNIKPKTAAGALMLIFGMVFFLLSIFWGNHLWFGEVIGELTGLMISLIGLSLLATYDFKIFAVSLTIFVIYSTLSYGFLQVSSIPNYVFTISASLVFMTWFFEWGRHATAGYEWKSIYSDEEDDNA